MKKVTTLEVTHVISEPGDCTRYDYLVVRDADNVFRFFPYENTFNYPAHIPLWDLDEANIELTAKKFNCNPHTVAECMRTMREMTNDG